MSELLQTVSATVVNDSKRLLRAAIFGLDGKDKDVTSTISKSFMKYNRNALDLSIEFSTKLQPDDIETVFDMTKEHMEDIYEESGYGWDDDDKQAELTEAGARYLLVRNVPTENNGVGELVGFVHFSFTLQGEVIDQMMGLPCLHVYDVQLASHVRRKGLGKHLLVLLELIAHKEKMQCISMPVYAGHEDAKNWVTRARGFAVDISMHVFGFCAEAEGFEMYSKVLTSVQRAAPASAAPVTAATSASASTTPLSQVEQQRIVRELTDLYRLKHQHEPSEEEIQQWVSSISDVDASDLAGPPSNSNGATGRNRERQQLADSGARLDMSMDSDDGWVKL